MERASENFSYKCTCTIIWLKRRLRTLFIPWCSMVEIVFTKLKIQNYELIKRNFWRHLSTFFCCLHITEKAASCCRKLKTASNRPMSGDNITLKMNKFQYTVFDMRYVSMAKIQKYLIFSSPAAMWRRITTNLCMQIEYVLLSVPFSDLISNFGARRFLKFRGICPSRFFAYKSLIYAPKRATF